MTESHSHLSPDDYHAAIMHLLPRGPAWVRAPGTVLWNFCAAIADFFHALHRRIANFSDVESDPAQAVELLGDWERAFGLPDACAPENQGVDARRAALIGRITDAGGAADADLISLAEKLGYPGVKIIRFTPFTTNSCTTDSLNSAEGLRFTFLVSVPAGGGQRIFNTNSATTESLLDFGNAALECALRQRRHAGASMLIGYSEG